MTEEQQTALKCIAWIEGLPLRNGHNSVENRHARTLTTRIAKYFGVNKEDALKLVNNEEFIESIMTNLYGE